MSYPKYVSHKIVGAVKISGVDLAGDGSMTVALDEGFPSVTLSHADRMHKPIPQPGWYLVQYEDGYISFSPPKAFEEGYKLLTEDVADGSGSDKYGASDWTAMGYTKDGFPCAKGSPEDVSEPAEKNNGSQ